MNCRHCNSPLETSFVDLGFAPPSNAYLDIESLSRPEVYYPLKVMVCSECWLVQTEDYADAASLFTPDYAYFSSTSKTWLEHARCYSSMIIERLALDRDSLVIEVGANDGYLLRNFVENQVPCLGIEPTTGTAEAARQLNIPVVTEFLTAKLAKRLLEDGQMADLIVGNNVFAHVPDINDFSLALKTLLKPEGTITLEFPHLLNLVEYKQFDTIYHEHFSYLSLTAANRILQAGKLRIQDLEQLDTHGGSLRIYVVHDTDSRTSTEAVGDMLRRETEAGLTDTVTYEAFQGQAERIKNELLRFLLEARVSGKSVEAYGAAAKGNTLLNFAGVKADLVRRVYDAAPSKQGKFMPGSHIPICSPQDIERYRPDYLLILPWNLKTEIVNKLAGVRAWGCRFVTAIPAVGMLD